MNKPVESLPRGLAPPVARALRDALGTYATGVTVVATRAPGGAPIGLTVNSFNAVSLSPPLIVWSLSLASPSLEVFRRCRHYAINVLALDQLWLSQRFSSRSADRFAGVAWEEGLDGVPLLHGCCAGFECANETQHAGGDHLLFIGRVLRHRHHGREPLVFQGGRYRALRDL